MSPEDPSSNRGPKQNRMLCQVPETPFKFHNVIMVLLSVLRELKMFCLRTEIVVTAVIKLE